MRRRCFTARTLFKIERQVEQHALRGLQITSNKKNDHCHPCGMEKRFCTIADNRAFCCGSMARNAGRRI